MIYSLVSIRPVLCLVLLHSLIFIRLAFFLVLLHSLIFIRWALCLVLLHSLIFIRSALCVVLLHSLIFIRLALCLVLHYFFTFRGCFWQVVTRRSFQITFVSSFGLLNVKALFLGRRNLVWIAAPKFFINIHLPGIILILNVGIVSWWFNSGFVFTFVVSIWGLTLTGGIVSLRDRVR